jgi:hypothetical protein
MGMSLENCALGDCQNNDKELLPAVDVNGNKPAPAFFAVPLHLSLF